MTVLRIAAFSDGNEGGNPAGVWIGDSLPSAPAMQAIAADVGFSETAFAAPEGDAWRVRYFSPAVEVPFCGHATIALGAALALQHGERTFGLKLNGADISVAGRRDGETMAAALQSPPTRSAALDPKSQADLLRLFGYAVDDLDMRIPSARIHAGADHMVLALKSRATLARMTYDLARGRALMEKAGLITIALVVAQSAQLFHVRNAFAIGGVMEDPATGSAGTLRFARPTRLRRARDRSRRAGHPARRCRARRRAGPAATAPVYDRRGPPHRPPRCRAP